MIFGKHKPHKHRLPGDDAQEAFDQQDMLIARELAKERGAQVLENEGPTFTIIETPQSRRKEG